MTDLSQELAEPPVAVDDPVCKRIQVKIVLILAVFAILTSAVARWWLLHSPLHMDEYTYLFVGRLFELGESWPTLTYIFGADFNWHMFGWAHSILDNHLSARLLSLFFALLSLIGVYFLVNSVWHSKLQATCSVLLLSITAPHIYISSIATYDVIAFCLFTWAMFFFWKLALDESASDSEDLVAEKVASQRAQYWFFVGSMLLIAACLSKYVLILYLPPLLLLLLIFKPRFVLPAVLLVGGALLLYVFVNKDSLQVLYETQILITQSANIERQDLIFRMVSLVSWLMGLLLFVWLIYSIIRPAVSGSNISQGSNSSNLRLPGVTPQLAYLLLATPLPLYHIISSNQIALMKHLSYFYLFTVPLIAYGITQVFRLICNYVSDSPENSNKTARMFLGACTVCVFSAFIVQVIISNAKTANQLSRGFPDMTATTDYWQSKRYESEHSGRILSEDPYLFRYAALPDFPQALISETTFLDNDLDGAHSRQDVRDAIWDRKFSWVLLTDQIHPEENHLYRRLLSLRGYELAVSKPYFVSGLLSGNRHGNVELYHLSKSKKIALSD